MGIIEKSFGIKRTFENVGRLKEILTVMARNGFDEIFMQTGLLDKIPNFVLPKAQLRLKEFEGDERKDYWHSIGVGLRKSFEELGPSFIKIGQLLSTRDDIFDDSFIDEMMLLRDQAEGVSFTELKPYIEKSLGKDINEVFSSFNEQPIGTASIGIVFEATLKNSEDVVVKVRRPNISKAIDNDFAIIVFITTQIEKAIEEFRYLGFSKVLKDFHITLVNELDFHVEALNCKRLKSNIAEHDKDNIYHIPKIHSDYTCADLLVMEKISGIPFSNKEKINEVLPVVQKKLENGLGVFIKTVLIDGFFHADLHGGNFFLLKNEKVAIIDFGLVGSLGKKGRLSFVSIIYSMITHNFENLVYELLDVADYDKIPDVDELIKDIRDSLSPFIGLTVKQTNIAHLLRSILTVLSKHQIYLPREWFIIFRAMITLDGVGKSLDMDIDLLSLIQGEMGTIIKKSVSKDELIEEGVWIARDVVSSLRVLPRHLRWFVKDISKKGYSLDIRNVGIEKMTSQITRSMRLLAYTFMSGMLLIAGCLVIDSPKLGSFYNIPFLSYLLWVLSGIVFSRVLLKK